ncbi:MAG: serine hydrolase [Candidatus Pacebacteria bacterium]|nr:serine hydrolase [Candidatus Paceibacterota bacterium]PIR63461.1 MAG: hypothetical protein COU64_04660 [Candidatus Pacebacteria bacterium CG10_big_fil_rev_8_21_14_0_10_40_26]PIZ79600.1 MAG: hypothetical protein COY01_00565 [Candidatus Pacebacteria bacterium CG_4_10_14_0_2_um_filter_40_20]PJA69053.1 MAG: hypothetical protein CO156_01815 [Candidatus Pacebacteria bacterium CG_4_9_14_3_um_filter_40_12]PJC41814.1 MAG: hypothetical protein CO041_03790 [Candidatus Pacebacteria bacterium CG_4_9_14_0
MKKNLILFLVGVLFGSVPLLLYFGRKNQSESSKTVLSDYREIRETGHRYIEPLLECDADIMSPRLQALDTEITTKMEQLHLRDATNVYYRNLRTGLWLGINENEKIAPASLSKVLILLAVYKKSEEYPALLDEEFLYANQFLFARNLDTEEYKDMVLENGKKYTVSDLVARMIKYSDNESASSLQYILNKHYPDFLQSFEQQTHMEFDGEISLKDYSNMFRMLYNASYLNRVNSEKALSLLTQSQYKMGLVAGIPNEIEVASKFGYYDPPPEAHEKFRFNQCQIVFHPENPYLLCVSSASESLPELRSAIPQLEQLSKHIYEWVNAHPVEVPPTK